MSISDKDKKLLWANLEIDALYVNDYYLEKLMN